MKSSMDVLSAYKKGRKIAILGTMNELGDEAVNAHTEVGSYAKDKVDLLIAIGSYKECFRKGYSLDSILTFEDKKDFIDDLKTIIKENDVILVKASRGMKFEEIVNSLEEADV